MTDQTLAQRVDQLPNDLATKIWSLARRRYLAAAQRVALGHALRMERNLTTFKLHPPKYITMFSEHSALYSWTKVRNGLFLAPWPFRKFKKQLKALQKKSARRYGRARWAAAHRAAASGAPP